jgi:hypothetical protein
MGIVLPGFGITHGVPLSDGRRDLTLYLPNREVKLSVVSMPAMLSRDFGQVSRKPAPLGQKTFTPKRGEINRIEIKVKPPPEVDK